MGCGHAVGEKLGHGHEHTQVFKAVVHNFLGMFKSNLWLHMLGCTQKTRVLKRMKS